MAHLKKSGYSVDRGYAENIHTLLPISAYDLVVTPIRDPIARNISWFFEKNGLRMLQENKTNEEIKAEFLKKIDHSYPLRWFDTIYRLVTMIDIYNYGFSGNALDIDNKFTILRIDKFEPEHRANTIYTRNYGSIYYGFLQWVKLSAPYVDLMYNSKFAQHFFSEKELEERRIRWQE